MSVHRSKTRGPGLPTEATLLHQAQRGNRQALNRLMAQHDRLVHAFLQRHGSGQLAYADALQAGRMGLWRAIRWFNPVRGFAFSTYAWTCIMRQIGQAVKAETRFLAPLRSTDRTGLGWRPNPAQRLEPDPVGPLVHDLVRRLAPRLQEVVLAHYGLDGEVPANFAQLGRTLGVSEERVRQLHQEALIWLRQPAHSQALRSLLRRHTLTDYQSLEMLNRRWWHPRCGRHAD